MGQLEFLQWREGLTPRVKCRRREACSHTTVLTCPGEMIGLNQVTLKGNEVEANWWRHWRLCRRDSASVCTWWARVKSNVTLWFLVYKSRIHALFAEIRCTDGRIIWGKYIFREKV